MKKLLILVLPALVLVACGGNEAEDNRREVEKDARQHDYVPIEATDKALRTEAMGTMPTIVRQVKLKAATMGTSERRQFYGSISGNLNDAKCRKLGLTAGSLKGAYYVAGDYQLSFSGSKLTITVANPGTRGRVEPKTFTVP